MKYIRDLSDIYKRESKPTPVDITERIDTKIARKKIEIFPEGPLDVALSDLYFHLKGNIVLAYHTLERYEFKSGLDSESFAIIKARNPTPLSNSPYVVLMRELDQKGNNLSMTFWSKYDCERRDLTKLIENKYNVQMVLSMPFSEEASAYISYCHYPVVYTLGNNKKVMNWVRKRLEVRVEKTIDTYPRETQLLLKEWINLLKAEDKWGSLAQKLSYQANDLLEEIKGEE